MKVLESFGFEHKDIMSSVSKGEFNQITSSLFLLEKKERLLAIQQKKAKEAKKKEKKESTEKKKDAKKKEKEKEKEKKEKKKGESKKKHDK